MDDDMMKEGLMFGDESELVGLPAGTYPCVFKIGPDFYDYTLLKLASQFAADGYYYAINDLNTTQYIYSWCQQLGQIPASPCQGPVFAQSNDYATECVNFSGGAYGDIAATEILAQDVNFFNGSFAGSLSGTTLKYSGGAACPATGNP